jgi:hypothetical protein
MHSLLKEIDLERVKGIEPSRDSPDKYGFSSKVLT